MGPDLSGIDFDNIKYFVVTENMAAPGDDLPEDIRATHDKLGIPEAEKQRLMSGVAPSTNPRLSTTRSASTPSSRVSPPSAPTRRLVSTRSRSDEYFTTVIPTGDSKFCALNTAVWSGGSFIDAPKGVHVDIPLQADSRINTENIGRAPWDVFIADEGSFVHYVECCTAPTYSSESLHSAVVEIVVRRTPGAQHHDPEMVDEC